METEEPSDCYSAHGGGGGCDDPVCEEIVCDEDEFCCEDSWDSTCADIADDLCSGDPITKVDSVESVVESVNYFKKPLGIFGGLTAVTVLTIRCFHCWVTALRA